MFGKNQFGVMVFVVKCDAASGHFRFHILAQASSQHAFLYRNQRPAKIKYRNIAVMCLRWRNSITHI